MSFTFFLIDLYTNVKGLKVSSLCFGNPGLSLQALGSESSFLCTLATFQANHFQKYNVCIYKNTFFNINIFNVYVRAGLFNIINFFLVLLVFHYPGHAEHFMESSFIGLHIGSLYCNLSFLSKTFQLMVANKIYCILAACEWINPKI